MLISFISLSIAYAAQADQNIPDAIKKFAKSKKRMRIAVLDFANTSGKKTRFDGYIADTATTICLEPQLKMLVVAAEAALDAGLRIMRAGTKASEVGSVIERTMKMMGVVSIRNLTSKKKQPS